MGQGGRVFSVSGSLQLLATCLFGGSGTALSTVPANFQASHDNVEAAIALNLALEPVEEIAFEFHDLSTAQARHVNVVPLRTTLIKMLFPLHVHEIEFIDQSMALEKAERAIDGNAVDSRVQFARVTQNLGRVEVLLRSFYDAEDGASLMRQANAA